MPKTQTKGISRYLDEKWVARNEKDLQEMSDGHEKLINIILAEEEELITAHKEHIDNMVGIIKGEMTILNEVDQPGSDVDEYTSALKGYLEQQVKHIMSIKGRVERFTQNLRIEEEVSKKFYKFQSEILGIQDN